MFRFSSLSGFLASQLITHCLFSTTLSWATSVTGIVWRDFDGFLPAVESSASPMPARGQCALECQRHAGCQGFFYNDVSKICVKATSDSDFDQTGLVDSGFHYYTNKYKCPVTTSNDLLHVASTSCFAIIDTPELLWGEARDHCTSSGGQLAVLDTRGKVNFLMNVMQNNAAYTSVRYHLGASRPLAMFDQPWPASGQDYVWLNGQPLDMTVAAGYWKGVEPDNNGQDDNFIQMYNAPSRLWVDGADQAVGYICQYPLV